MPRGIPVSRITGVGAGRLNPLKEFMASLESSIENVVVDEHLRVRRLLIDLFTLGGNHVERCASAGEAIELLLRGCHSFLVTDLSWAGRLHNT